MITVIVGHRGTGKTQFLFRLKKYFTDLNLNARAVFIDLDEEIANRTGQSIERIFQSETAFRKLESDVFNDLYRQYRHSQQDAFISLGAGFSAPIPNEVEVWWLRRESDRRGRVFLSRPRLEPNMSPLDEYQARFLERESRFREISRRSITIGEGWDKLNEFEKKLIGLLPADLGVSVTMTPWILQSKARQDSFFARCLQLGVQYFELRDDLLTEAEIRSVAAKIPLEKVLISFRKAEPSKSLIDFAGPFATDWAIELGPSPLVHNTIVSLHARQKNETVDEAASRLLQHKAEHHKLAIPIHDLTELWVGHQFFLAGKTTRSFLPVSQKGRWRWYRLIQRPKLNFARESVDEGVDDQPFLFDFLAYPKGSETFAAILGSPVEHSRTPAEQFEFFQSYAMGVVAIPVEEDELHSLNLGILDRIGLRAAAVTAPLKVAALRVCEHVDKKAADVGAVNTIVKTPAGWSGTNTDLIGVARTFHSLKLKSETAVWGGGGTRLVLRALLPEARFFSARHAEQIWANQTDLPYLPQSLIWAVARTRMSTSQWPPDSWHPEFVFDLNYADDSPGLEYAIRTGARYFSGLNLFLIQAEAQREFWSHELGVSQ